jgi:hypothetical protein
MSIIILTHLIRISGRYRRELLMANVLDCVRLYCDVNTIMLCYWLYRHPLMRVSGRYRRELIMANVLDCVRLYCDAINIMLCHWFMLYNQLL